MPKMSEFKATAFIQSMATVMEPKESDAPILADDVRVALRNWMIEVGAEEQLKKVKLEPRKRIMFDGPPGCGKTTMAHHMACRLGLPLVILNMQSLVSSYLGETGRNIDQIYADLRPQAQHCILFMDEFDAIASKRDGGGHSERNSIVIAVLQKMDSYRGIIMAATNRKADIDPAIWRRFDMQINISEPSSAGRFAILKRYLLPYEADDDLLETLSSASGGATPVLLKQIAESIKRDLVLAKKLGIKDDAKSCLRRAVIASNPHKDFAIPPLWDDPEEYGAKIEELWPPVLPKKAA